MHHISFWNIDFPLIRFYRWFRIIDTSLKYIFLLCRSAVAWLAERWSVEHFQLLVLVMEILILLFGLDNALERIVDSLVLILLLISLLLVSLVDEVLHLLPTFSHVNNVLNLTNAALKIIVYNWVVHAWAEVIFKIISWIGIYYLPSLTPRKSWSHWFLLHLNVFTIVDVIHCLAEVQELRLIPRISHVLGIFLGFLRLSLYDWRLGCRSFVELHLGCSLAFISAHESKLLTIVYFDWVVCTVRPTEEHSLVHLTFILLCFRVNFFESKYLKIRFFYRSWVGFLC